MPLTAKIWRYAKRALRCSRAVVALGPMAARRLIECGPGMSAAITAGSRLEISSRVSFGERCGISVASMPGQAPALLSIGQRTSFQSGLSLNCAERVTIGADCAISWDVHILDTDFHQIIHLGGVKRPKCAPISIGDRVWIGSRVTVLKGVSIGSDSMIAAGSIVTRSFPPRSLIAGNPARLVREIEGWHL